MCLSLAVHPACARLAQADLARVAVAPPPDAR
ncbi:MAG: electron transporter, partial [Parafilimonas terrae]|nr:electron transporter [Parafilimonas terrae]